MMREKSLSMCWADQDHNATVISAKKESSFRSPAPSYSWVTKLLRALKSAEDIVEPCECSGRSQDPLIGMRVLEFLNSTPFPSIRQMATATKKPRSIVLDDLNGWRCTVRHLKWALYHLTTAMTQQRVELSRELLVTLRSVKHRS
jgi:hypothetical protein